MKFAGLVIGAFSFLIIGIFHPIVIWCEYHFSSKAWPAFLLVGLLCLLISVAVAGMLSSALLAVVGFTCLWSIGELREQEKRVEKGWFPANPKRKQ